MAAPESLARLARLHGVHTRYRDGFREYREPSPETLIAVLKGLGAPLETSADAPEAVADWRRRHWSSFAPPAAVSWGGRELRLPLRLPAADAEGRLRWSLEIESGESISGTLDLGSLAPRGAVELGGVRFVAKTLELAPALPSGYHLLRLETAGREAETLLIAAPDSCHQPSELGPMWGAFLPLYALHSDQSLGAGNFSDLGRLMDWVREHGGRLVGTLPLLAAFLDQPYEYSPYVPASRLHWNEFYLDPRSVPEWERSAQARRELDSAKASGLLDELRRAPLVDYRRQAALQRRLLEPLAEAAQGDPERAGALRSFVAARPAVADYAAFRAAVEQSGRTWDRWPQRLRDGTLAPGDYRPEDRAYHLYVQWLCDSAMAELSDRAGTPGLYLDLPLGVHPGGYDVWRNRESFALAVSGGAPPDRFFTKGQNWGFAPLHPEAIRRDGYRHLIAVLRHHLRYAGVLRIDHFMWLHRLYWIPAGAEASQGTYVQYRAEEIYAILSIESQRARALIVGEDLGTVPSYVRERMTQRGIDRMFVAQFSLTADAAEPLRRPPANSLASVNTHDTPTWAAFWEARDIDDQLEMGLVSETEASAARLSRGALRKRIAEKFRVPEEPGAALEAILERLAASDARAVMLTLEDLWGEVEQQNTPGTGPERPNWQRRAKRSLEEIVSGEARVLERLRRR